MMLVERPRLDLLRLMRSDDRIFIRVVCISPCKAIQVET